MNKKIVMILLLLQAMSAKASLLSRLAQKAAPRAQGRMQKLAQNFSTIKTEGQVEEESLGKITLVIFGAGLAESLPYAGSLFLARVCMQ